MWEDYRNASLADIYGARVLANGTPLDSTGIAISAVSGSSQAEPDTVYSGVDYMVVWRDGRNGGIADVFGARMSTLGQLLDQNGFAISTAPSHQRYPAVARAEIGTDCLVVWHDTRVNPPDIYARRVDSSGTLLGSEIPINTSADFANRPAIAAKYDEYLVVFRHGAVGGDIFGARVTTSGTVLDPTGSELKIAIQPQNQDQASVAWDGARYLAVHQSNLAKTRANIVVP